MAPRQELPQWLLAQPFTAFDHSVKRGRMAGPDVLHMFHGVRAVVGSPGDWRDRPPDEALRIRCRALLRVVAPGTFFGSITAARLWGLPLPLKWLEDQTIYTVTWYPDRAPNRAGVTGRQVNDWNAERVFVSDLPTIDLPTLFCHLGMVLSIPDLVAVGDAMILEPVHPAPDTRPPVPLEALKARVELYHGRGKRCAAQALAMLRPGAESRPESLTRLLLVGAGLPEPELNVKVFGGHGEFLGRVDMLFRTYRVIVEYDGDQHRTDQAQFDRDLGRLDDLTAQGWRVVRIGGRTLFRNPQEVIVRVRRALVASGWTPDGVDPAPPEPYAGSQGV